MSAGHKTNGFLYLSVLNFSREVGGWYEKAFSLSNDLLFTLLVRVQIYASAGFYDHTNATGGRN